MVTKCSLQLHPGNLSGISLLKKKENKVGNFILGIIKCSGDQLRTGLAARTNFSALPSKCNSFEIVTHPFFFLTEFYLVYEHNWVFVCFVLGGGGINQSKENSQLYMAKQKEKKLWKITFQLTLSAHLILFVAIIVFADFICVYSGFCWGNSLFIFFLFKLN